MDLGGLCGGEGGIDLSALSCCDEESGPLRVVCVNANVGEVLDEMGQSKRDQVVMVRVDEAKQDLRQRVREVLGTDGEEEGEKEG